MLNLHTCAPEDVRMFARKLYEEHMATAETFEDAAQAMTKSVYDEFVRADGSPLFGLVRVFRFGPRNQLPPEWVDQVDKNVSYFLAVVGTMGIEEAWCDRKRSDGHQAIPADDAATPMVRAMFDQLGLKFGGDFERSLEVAQHEQSFLTRYFHVPVAAGSPYVPVQGEFVEQYGIASVFGVGTAFAGGDTAYTLIGFSREPLDKAEADKLSELGAFVGTALAAHNEGQIWN